MRKSDLNFLIDSLAFACFLFMVATGVIMEYLLPPGSGEHVTIWGLDRHEWGTFHFWLAVVFLASLAVHVYLHWSWIVAVLRRRPSEGSGIRMGLGVSALIALLAIAMAPLVSPVEQDNTAAGRLQPQGGLSDEVEDIQGAMTLGQMAAQTGVPVDSLLYALGLPTDLSVDERVGRLAREHGFDVTDVRAVVERIRSGREVEPTPVSAHATEDLEVEAAQSDPAEQPGGRNTRADPGEEIRGSMTLAELLAITDVPLRHLTEQLGLPEGISSSERLGRLARQYGFTLVGVREVLQSYRPEQRPGAGR